MPKSATHTQGGYVPDGASYIGNVVNQPDNLADIAVSNLVATGPLTRASVSSIVSDKFIRGSGAPNGVVSAVVGTLYVDTAKTLGAAVWRKDSGTGNTGWVVHEGDTGPRRLEDADFATGWTAYAPGGGLYALAAQRVGRNVTIGAWLTTSGSGSLTLFTLPVGLRPTRLLYASVLNSAGSPVASNYFQILPDGTVNVRSAPVAGLYIFPTLTYATSETWLSTLPWSPA